uniref:Uncharacterized protein n=1 Tax=Anopheles quadriannulatus TaxID=34691 RepID=A0A182XP53_ANOQN
MATTWIPTSVHGPYPSHMVPGGVDSDGAQIFVGRAHHGGDLLPAKVIPDKTAAYVAYGGQETLVEHVEVLVHKQLIWDTASSGQVPLGAVVGGHTSDGEMLYVGRAYHEGSQTIGKVQCSHNCIYIPYGGAEVSVPTYEVLPDLGRDIDLHFPSYDTRHVIIVIIMSGAGCWQHCNVNGPFPPNMVRAGVDSDGEVIYVGRAFHEGDMVPAKVIPTKNVAFVCHGGEEVLKEDFEVLRYGAFVWEYSSNGSVPETAMKIGQTMDGEPLYMGRAIYSGSQTPGKVHPSHGCCYLPFDGAEVSVTDYEVLCIR